MVLGGTTALLVNVGLTAWLLSAWCRRTELHPYGFQVIRTWSP
jgi:hypothetical protein